MRNNPFIQTTELQEQEMLAAIGARSLDELFSEQIPPSLLTSEAGSLPSPCGELELVRRLKDLASQCKSATDVVSFLGGGCYDHFIPAAVDHIANRSEFLTAYTPYQPEASQGALQAFFEYQTLMARLYAMDVSNASLYDGASALGEAVFLALSVHPDRKRVILPFTLHPHYREVVRSYVQHLDVEVVEIEHRGGVTDCEKLKEVAANEAAAVVSVQPNFFGCLEDVDAFSDAARRANAVFIAVADPLSLGLLKPPGEYGADVAVGEGQPLGLRTYLGGESLGIFTCRWDYLRRMPGRLVGLTRDREGKRGYVLTLQTREQHIRREKATSNICTNHAHNALRATIFLSLVGPQGLRAIARKCARNLALFKSWIASESADAVAFRQPAFRETVIRLNTNANVVCEKLLERGFFAGIPLEILGPAYEDLLLVAVTEKRTDAEIKSFVKALREFLA
ncbi:MAG: aminomethyl-transferring glycine dehydrogenase subunit GcvPA [Candidatus Sumerlaeaceae bacterium]|nr:aminomethyl-transferring glycine dehydrogenase subunit GcvPA [Candidatus Sumerlaeaceae bacterium]